MSRYKTETTTPPQIAALGLTWEQIVLLDNARLESNIETNLGKQTKYYVSILKWTSEITSEPA